MPKGSVLVKPGSVPLKSSRKSGVHSIKWTTSTANSKKAYEASESCIVPLIKCIYAGEKPPPTSSADGVKMTCNNDACPFKGNPYVHKECFEQLEADLTEVMAKTGPGRAWPRRKCHANLWTHHGLPYLKKYIRCRCENGHIVLDREAYEEAKETEKAETRQRKLSEKEVVQPAMKESKLCANIQSKPKCHGTFKVVPGWASKAELEMRHWQHKSLFEAQFVPPSRTNVGYNTSSSPWMRNTHSFREEKPPLHNIREDEADSYLKRLRGLRM